MQLKLRASLSSPRLAWCNVDLFFLAFTQVGTTRVVGVEFATRGGGQWQWWPRRRAQIEKETDDGPRALPGRDATVRGGQRHPYILSPSFIDLFFSFFLKCSGIIRAVNASHFGAPQDAAGRSHSHSVSSSTSSLHEGSTGAGSSHLSALHSMLRYHHHHRHDGGGAAAAAGGGISDSGSDTASIEGAAGMSASPEERRHRHRHIRRLKQLVR